MANLLRTLAARLPSSWVHELKRVYYACQIRRGRFRTDEREYDLLDSMVANGDWVIDVGANIGHYTLRLSTLVGEKGRVFALEPVLSTFALLASNVLHGGATNVTLLNIAASDTTSTVGMTIPRSNRGVANYYQAHITGSDAELAVVRTPLDALPVPSAVRLVKIDAEGHELEVLRGMVGLLERDHPALILETEASPALALLHELGYESQRSEGSANVILAWRGPGSV